MDHRMRPILAHLVLLLLSQCIHAFIPGADGPVSNQEGLEGGNTTLLCDTSPEQSGDELMLLVWYKNNAPVYSFDARAASEWSSEVFNESSRVLINRSQQPTELTITNLREDDEALYHCRVDLLQSQTRNLGVNLTVVVLPSQPFFLDEVGNKVENKIGPYHEGDTLVISCLVIGGRPPPRISWYSGYTLVDASDGASDIPGVKENELYLPLTREHSGVLSCRASNTVLKEPVVSSLLVELFLPAQNVSILWLEGADSDEALQVGRPAVVQCVAEGSHPAPDLSWWLDHQLLTQHSNQTWLNSTNTAVSHLQLTPSVADNGATLSCIATNVAMAPSRGSKADVITLNVTYSPIVEVVKVGNGKLNEVVELDTLHLVCEIRANPPVDRIMWYFDDNKIMPGGLWGDNTSLASLVVEEALRTHAGAYSCAAGNSVGETRASHLSVTVLYPPQCSRKGITISQETIHCDVNALPPPDTYFWHMKPDGLDTQHLTTGSAILPLDQITGPLAGTLHVVCEAGNGIASQEKACEKNLSLEYLRPPQPRQCDLAFEYEEFQMRCIPVENASYYEVSVWRMSSSNTSLVLARRGAMGWGAGGRAQAARGGVGGAGAQAQGVAGGWLVRGGLGMLREGDEAGSAACNRFGCSRALLLRPTEKLLRASEPPWWNFFLERDVSLFLGAIVVVCVFVLSTWLAVHLARRSREKTPAQVIQLLRREVATEYMEHKRHAGCSARSCSSGYSGCSLDSEPPPPPLAPLGDRLHPPAPLVERHRKPMYYWEPPPDVTLTLTRESAV